MNTITMTDEQSKKLEELVSISGHNTPLDLINDALTLYEFKVSEEKEGRFLASIDKESKQYFRVSLSRDAK
ncbi:hypothetical protein P7410_16115 [Vibrio parahaemolyticus]|nr:hypothetical protein [Vibrio parahaemolyticus]